MLVLALLATAVAQTRDQPWRTLETEHFRVIYPRSAEEWSTRAASELEAIRARVVGEIGFDPKRRIEILIRDPYSDANGAAFTLLGRPRIEAWAEPPGPDIELGPYGRWEEMLFLHETVHVVHLVRPSRNPLLRLVTSLVGAGPVAMNSPRWVIEGYATVLEGRLTGGGRPNSDTRASWLRMLAAAGRMPTYGGLDGNARWGGGSDAYLVGSAYLEWLDARKPGSLASLWRAMSARRMRSFDVAFKAVYGESASVLYGQFVAGLVADAVPLVGETQPWLDSSGWTGRPAVSRDGASIAIPVDRGEHKIVLEVLPTAEDPKAREHWEDKVKRDLERDPEDITPLPPPFFHGEPKVRHRPGRPPEEPRFLPDGSVLFTAFAPDLRGRIRPDLYRWDPAKHREHRVTRGQDVRDADPSPDGTWAVAEQHRWGRSALVRVDLGTGEVTTLLGPTIEVAFDHPRIAPDGHRIAYVAMEPDGWRLHLYDVATSVDTEVALPPEVVASDPAWSPDGERLYAAIGQRGFLEIDGVETDGTTRPLSRTAGWSFAPDPLPDGSALFALTATPDGFQVTRIALPAGVAEPGPLPDSAVVRHDVPLLDAPTRAEVEPHRYGLGRVEPQLLGGFSLAPDGGALEAGLRLGDPVGRWEALLLGGYGDEGAVRGGRLALTSHALPVDLRVDGFADEDRQGGAATAQVQARFPDGALHVEGGAFLTKAGPTGFGEVALALREPHTAAFRLDLVGRATRGAAELTSGEAKLTIGRDPRLVLGYAAGQGAFAFGRTTSIEPEPLRWGTLLGPFTDAAGERTDAMSVDFASGPGIGIFGERDRLGDRLGPDGWTAVGVRGRFKFEGYAFLGVPAVEIQGGVACRLEVAGEWDDAPCDRLSDYGGWGGLTWRP